MLESSMPFMVLPPQLGDCVGQYIRVNKWIYLVDLTLYVEAQYVFTNATLTPRRYSRVFVGVQLFSPGVPKKGDRGKQASSLPFQALK